MYNKNPDSILKSKEKKNTCINIESNERYQQVPWYRQVKISPPTSVMVVSCHKCLEGW